MIKEWITIAAETREEGLDGNVEIKIVRNGWMSGIFEKENQYLPLRSPPDFNKKIEGTTEEEKRENEESPPSHHLPPFLK